jgi:hypothetical protein
MSETQVQRRNVTISGETFEITAPYAAGHTLNEAEASVLNQTFLENIRNNAAGKIKAAKAKAESDGAAFSLDAPVGGEGEDAGKTLRQLIQEYAETYEFGVRVARTSEPVDPVERECRSIARDAINAKLKAQGIKRKDVPDEAYEQAVSQYAGLDKVLKEAKRRVKEREAIGSEELDLGALGITVDPADSEEEFTEGQEA